MFHLKNQLKIGINNVWLLHPFENLLMNRAINHHITVRYDNFSEYYFKYSKSSSIAHLDDNLRSTQLHPSTSPMNPDTVASDNYSGCIPTGRNHLCSTSCFCLLGSGVPSLVQRHRHRWSGADEARCDTSHHISWTAQTNVVLWACFPSHRSISDVVCRLHFLFHDGNWRVISLN